VLGQEKLTQSRSAEIQQDEFDKVLDLRCAGIDIIAIAPFL